MAMTLDQQRAIAIADANIRAAQALSTNQQGASGQVPLEPGQYVRTAADVPTEPSLGQRIVGAGEAALATGTGAITGTLGMLGGTLKGLAEQILGGKFGTIEANRMVEQSASEGAAAGTYAPRTEAGKEYTEKIGELVSQLPPVIPGINELAGARFPTRASGASDLNVLRKEQMASATKAIPATTSGEIKPAELAALIKKAETRKIGSERAQEQLAELAKINLEAKAAADRLGVEVPVDVFSDNPQIRAAIGLTRSAVGSEAESSWRTIVPKALDKFDEALQQFDAQFIEGSPAVGAVSQKVRESLTKTREDLNAQSKKMFDEVNAQIPKQTPVEFPRLKKTLEEIKTEVGVNGMSRKEGHLFEMLKDESVPYGRLVREKNLVGQAIQGKESPYGNMEEGALKRLYGALAEDQLTNVGAVGGESLRQKLRAANLLYSKERALGKRIVNAFGQDVDGSIAHLMRNTITSSAVGDSAKFSKLLKIVPDDLKKETVATALASVVRSGRGSEQWAFGASEFAKIYPKLRANTPVYSAIVKTLGEESNSVLRDLYEVSKRITEARANVLMTGKANQAILSSLNADNLIEKVLQSTAAKAVITGVSAAGGGPVAAGAASALTTALTKSNKDALVAAGKLFASQEFQELAMQAATQPQIKPQKIKRLVRTQQFRNFAKSIKLPNSPMAHEQWVAQALANQRIEDPTNQN